MACARCFATMSLIGLLAHGARAAEAYTEHPGTEGKGKYTIGPDYKIDPDLTDRGNPKGKYFEFTMRLADSKIFESMKNLSDHIRICDQRQIISEAITTVSQGLLGKVVQVSPRIGGMNAVL